MEAPARPPSSQPGLPGQRMATGETGENTRQTAATREQAMGRIEVEEVYCKKTENARTKARENLEKILAREEKTKKKADEKIEKLQKKKQTLDSKTDKNAVQITKLQAKRHEIESSGQKRNKKADSAIKKAESVLAQAQKKYQKALAEAEHDPTKPIRAGLFKHKPSKALYMLEDDVDKLEQKLLMAQKNKNEIPRSIQMETKHIDNRCLKLNQKVLYDLEVIKYKLSTAVHERDVKLSQLAQKRAIAELAVQQYERRLARRKGAVDKAVTQYSLANIPPTRPAAEEDSSLPPTQEVPPDGNVVNQTNSETVLPRATGHDVAPPAPQPVSA